MSDKVEQLEALREVDEAVGSSLDLDEVLERIVTNAVRLTNLGFGDITLSTDGGSILEYDEATDSFHVRGKYGSSPALWERLRGITIDRKSSLVGRAALADQPLEIPDLAAAERDEFLDTVFQDGWRSVLAVPMIGGDKIIGVLVIRRRGTGNFPPDVIELLETFASQSAVAIVNARLYRELETQSRELAIASNHKSEFLASMSHELRTPLNAVIGFSEVLLERMFGEINERQEEYLRDIWNSGRHLLELLNEILDLSKVEAGQMVLEPSTFSVSQRSGVHAGNGPRARRGARHQDLGRRRRRRWRDRSRRAAIQAGRPQPVVQRGEVHTGRRQRVRPRPPGRHRPRGHGDRHRYRSAPRGPGEDLRLLPAGRPRSGQGRGHGARTDPVATNRRAVRRPHVAGKHCRRGKYVRLRDSRRCPMAAERVAAHLHGEFPVVVLVDDDRASLDLMSAYLDDAPVQVIRATDGVSALELIRKVLPAAVVLDIRLPRLDGWHVLAELKAADDTAAIPVVIASVVDDRPQGQALGAAVQLLKPVSRDDLIDALRGVGALAKEGAVDG